MLKNFYPPIWPSNFMLLGRSRSVTFAKSGHWTRPWVRLSCHSCMPYCLRFILILFQHIRLCSACELFFGDSPTLMVKLTPWVFTPQREGLSPLSRKLCGRKFGLVIIFSQIICVITTTAGNLVTIPGLLLRPQALSWKVLIHWNQSEIYFRRHKCLLWNGLRVISWIEYTGIQILMDRVHWHTNMSVDHDKKTQCNQEAAIQGRFHKKTCNPPGKISQSG